MITFICVCIMLYLDLAIGIVWFILPIITDLTIIDRIQK